MKIYFIKIKREILKDKKEVLFVLSARKF